MSEVLSTVIVPFRLDPRFWAIEQTVSGAEPGTSYTHVHGPYRTKEDARVTLYEGDATEYPRATYADRCPCPRCAERREAGVYPPGPLDLFRAEGYFEPAWGPYVRTSSATARH